MSRRVEWWGYAIVIQQTDMGDCAVINALPMAL